MKRRGAVIGGVALAATAAGAGLALWHRRVPNAELWSMRFDTPTGSSLQLGAFRGRPLLLNFWATWCPPCVAELPLLNQFHRAQPAGGWQVVGLAVDNLAPVVGFLGRRPVDFAIGLAGLAGTDLSRKLGNSGGALPFTAVFDRRGALVQRKLGVIEPNDLQRWVEAES